MLKGIDISSHNGDIKIAALPIDFVIVKFTEGLTYRNPYRTKAQETLKANKLLGFYHYARNNDPEKEAQFFIDNTIDYQGIGIPVLDWEENQSVEWVNKFVRYYHEKTGCWPWIYSNPRFFNLGGVEYNCGRWIAWYPNVIRPTLDYDPGTIPTTDGLVCCWQYASDGYVPGHDGNLDINHFYGDAKAWNAYAKAGTSSDPDNDEANKVVVSVLENDEYKITVERK